MTQHHARQRLYFKISQTSLLLFGKIAHLSLSEMNILQIVFGHALNCRSNLTVTQAKRSR